MNQPLTKPKALRRGHTVGIVAPSSPPFEEGHFEFTKAWLLSLGLKYKVGKHIFANYSDLAGTDAQRLEDFHDLWSDPEVDAVWPIRGGNGAVRLLPSLDFRLIEQKPKILVGFSDTTGLLIPIHQKTGLVTFHGPSAGDFFQSAYTMHYFRKAVMNAKPVGLVSDPLKQTVWRPKYPPCRLVIAPGSASARLTGGSLTLVRQLMGTDFEWQTEGHLIFLEDVGEEPYSIDSMLCQLLLSGKLQQARGIIFGESVSCKPGSSRRTVLPLNRSVECILKERLGDLGIPVVYGLRVGHGEEKLTMPLGAMATLQVEESSVRFSIDEAAVTE